MTWLRPSSFAAACRRLVAVAGLGAAGVLVSAGAAQAEESTGDPLLATVTQTADIALVDDELLDETGDVTVSVAEETSQHLADIAEPVTAPVEAVVDPVVAPIAELTEPVIDVVEPTLQTVAPVIEPVTTPVEAVVDDVVEAAAPLLTTVAEPLEDVTKPVTAVVEPVVELVEPVTAAVEPVADVPEHRLVILEEDTASPGEHDAQPPVGTSARASLAAHIVEPIAAVEVAPTRGSAPAPAPLTADSDAVVPFLHVAEAASEPRPAEAKDADTSAHLLQTPTGPSGETLTCTATTAGSSARGGLDGWAHDPACLDDARKGSLVDGVDSSVPRDPYRDIPTSPA